MSEILVLDSGPLGELAGDPHKPKGAAAQARLLILSMTHDIVVPEIADYELRRELNLIGSSASLARLDEMRFNYAYDPLTTATMKLAARFWADVRRKGRSTADRHALDADVILAAQATLLAGPGDRVIVATTNPKHLERFVEARDWATLE